MRPGAARGRRLFDPDDAAYYPIKSAWVIGELAEAAWHAGRVDEAREHLAKLEAAAGSQPASWIGIGLRHARAMLAPDDNETHFQEAISADLDRWPFPRARLLLAYGEWLRRKRRIADSRVPLRSARATSLGHFAQSRSCILARWSAPSRWAVR